MAHDWPAIVTRALEDKGLNDAGLLDIFTKIDRRDFLRDSYKDIAYDDIPLAIGRGQTISQYSLVAFMTHALEISDAHSVLEVGTGSGYQTAILACLARDVVTLERIKSLQNLARKLLTEVYALTNITYHHADSASVLDAHQTFDRIIVTAAATSVPQDLVNLLNVDGIMVLPCVESQTVQRLTKIKKSAKNVHLESLFRVKFVPMRQGLVQ
ncbi:MAG: protein-L-isoaspartate(D-aspartate) O-methyltransferase [Rhodobacteraceae bacterium]|nr:protein-L-isoaspartate(D-aspartate) O-methyltransferase [Paracoccaceae bacterium]